MTRRAGRSASNDPGLAALLEAKADAICFVAKSSAYQVRVALETTNEENLASIRDSVKAAKEAGREVMLDCEHFFDGYKEDPEFALACAKAAYDSGARWVVLCDTNGGTMPHEVESIVSEVDKAYSRRSRRHSRPQRHRAGGGQFAGRGARRRAPNPGHAERAWRALRQRQSVFADPHLAAQGRICRFLRDRRVGDRMATLMKVSRTLDDMLNRAPNRHAPYVGESAFVTKTGIRPPPCSRIRKLTNMWRPRRSAIIAWCWCPIRPAAPMSSPSSIAPASPTTGTIRNWRLVEELKEREAAGYAYESANASFDLLARRTLGQVPEYFRVEHFDVNVEQRYNANGQRVTVAMAVVKVDVDGEKLISAAEGNGPVNALDVALRKDLGKYQKYIEGLKLIDYRVRILNGGTEAVTRVLIESEDEAGRALDHDRRLAQHHRRLVPGADGFGDLQAGEIRRAGVRSPIRNTKSQQL